MRLILLSLGLTFCATQLTAQVIWTEQFSAGSAARGTSAVGYPSNSGGTWSQSTNILGLGEGASANQWYVSGEECGNAAGVCGSACPNGDASLHISAIGGLCGTPDCGAAYNETGAANRTDKRIESPNINTLGYGGLTLSFNYIAAQGDDGVSVVYSCNGGATWLPLAPLSATLCCDCNNAFLCGSFGICCGGITACTGTGQGNWTTQNYALPVCAENISNLKIGFHWVNDGNGAGTDPSIAIDDITITSSTPLAVELESFNAEQVQSDIQLTWVTASESENDFFALQRRNAQGNFEQIAAIQGAGNSTNRLTYNYKDRNVRESENYYRLMMIDFNGMATFSDVIYVPFVDQFDIISVFPNPSDGSFVITIRNELESEANFKVVSLAGQSNFTQKALLQHGVNNVPLNLASIQPGHYMLEIEISGRRKYLNILIN